MKNALSSLLAAAVACSAGAWGQDVTGTVESNKLAARTGTFYVNTVETINNSKTESLGVAITSSGDVVIGWEDDGNDLTDLEAVWTLYSGGGVSITPDTTITSLAGGELTSKYLSYFRADKSAVPGNTSWGPKIKANLFGEGFGMGATSYALGDEVPELAGIQADAGGVGDFPSVQLLSNTAQPLHILSGLADAEAEPAGDVRIADWDYLANGNVVIVGESRQGDDLVTKYGGASAGNHAVFRIVTPTGQEVKSVALVSEVPEVNEIWHGVGVTENGFAVRFALGGRTKVRVFDNNGAPISTNIDVGEITGSAVAAKGGRGDGTGFHGNGKDAYVTVTANTDENGARQVWVTVLNANGTLRYSRSASEGVPLLTTGEADAAIDATGRVLVVFDGRGENELNAVNLVMGRVLNPDGSPVDKVFYVSETETPDLAFYESGNPRVAVRNDAFAVVWESQNSETGPGTRVVAGRLFGIAHKPGSIESVGLTRIVPDTPVIIPAADSLNNWEPYASVLGNSVFLIEGNAFAEDGTMANQRFVVMLQPVAGGTPKLVEGFYADNGQPYTGQINGSRQDGNPGRVAGDARPGATHYMVGAEASPHLYPEFQSDNRWNLGFDRLSDGRYGTVQAFALDFATLTPTPQFDAMDAVNGRLTEGGAGGNQIGRFGGDLVALDNGNFVVAVDDRSGVRESGNITTAVILAPDGTVVKESFVVENRDLWSNVAPFKGGFCIRVHENLHFFDNAGTLLKTVDQSTSGAAFDTGRGDGTRIAGHINSPYVFLAGKVTDGNIVKVAAWDARTQAFVASAEVSEAGFAGNFDRAGVAADALNRVTVGWVSQPSGYEAQQIAARVMVLNETAKTITPLTASFLPFINAAETGGIRSVEVTLAMTTKQILVGAKGEINLQNQPQNGANSPRQVNFYTVISHPDPKDDPTTPVGGGAPEFTKIQRNADGSITVEWTGGGALEAAPAVTGPWTLVPNATSPYILTPDQPAIFGRIKK